MLPFQAAGSQSLDHIATGVAEAMSAKLFGLSQVTVAPTSAIEGVDLKQSHAKLARELGSNLLVTGTVQGNDSRISIIIKLEDPIARKTIWSKEYPGSLNDLLTMQEQMFSGLVDALNVTPSSEERAKSIARPTQNIAAYDSYLKGRNALRGQQDRQNIEAAMNFFNEALRQDPRFALAFAGLSDASMAMYHDSADTKWATQAVYTAQQAERLDDSLVEVHAAMGQAYVATGRTNEAIVELRRALEIAPNSDEAYRRLAAAYRIAGQTDEAIKMHKLAIDKNPYYWINHNALGYTYWRIGDYENAAAEFKKVLEIEPDNVNGYNDLGAVYLQTGRYQDAADTLQKALKVGNTPDTWSNLGVAYAWMGRFAEALPAYQKAVEISPASDGWLSNLADGYRWLQRTKEANETYDKAIELAYKSLTVNPNDAATRVNLGTYYAKKGEFAQGLKFIDDVLAKNPDDQGYLYNSAIAHALAGHTDAALQALGKAFKAGYPPQFAKDDPDLRTLAGNARFKQLVQEARPAR